MNENQSKSHVQNRMRRFLFVVAAIVCSGCVQREKLKGPTEAGKVAIQCVQSMQKCEDWTPIKTASNDKRVELEDCAGFDDWSTEHDLCKKRNARRVDHNNRLTTRPPFRSPCQQQVDACVDLVVALQTGGPKTIHNHYEK